MIFMLRACLGIVEVRIHFRKVMILNGVKISGKEMYWLLVCLFSFAVRMRSCTHIALYAIYGIELVHFNKHIGLQFCRHSVCVCLQTFCPSLCGC